MKQYTAREVAMLDQRRAAINEATNGFIRGIRRMAAGGEDMAKIHELVYRRLRGAPCGNRGDWADFVTTLLCRLASSPTRFYTFDEVLRMSGIDPEELGDFDADADQ